MSSLKTLALAGALVATATVQAFAADLFPAAPPPPAYAPPPVAIAEASGWYLRGDVGFGLAEMKKASYTNLGPGDQFYFPSRNIETMPTIGIGVGYQFNNWLRGDLTAEYRGRSGLRLYDNYVSGTYAPDPVFGCDGFTYGGAVTGCNVKGFNGLNGSISSFVFMANGYVDLGTWYGVTPFVGAGVGVAAKRIGPVLDSGGSRIDSIAANGSILNSGPFGATSGYAPVKNNTGLAWALHAGLGYDVTQNLKLELSYRYLNLGSATTNRFFCYTPTGGTCISSALKIKNIDSHDFRIGMRWLLADRSIPVSAPLPAPALIRKY
jgi:opacity protein-like surface antigen